MGSALRGTGIVQPSMIVQVLTVISQFRHRLPDVAPAFEAG
jgi:hypothetical protein